MALLVLLVFAATFLVGCIWLWLIGSALKDLILGRPIGAARLALVALGLSAGLLGLQVHWVYGLLYLLLPPYGLWSASHFLGFGFFWWLVPGMAAAAFAVGFAAWRLKRTAAGPALAILVATIVGLATAEPLSRVAMCRAARAEGVDTIGRQSVARSLMMWDQDLRDGHAGLVRDGTVWLFSYRDLAFHPAPHSYFGIQGRIYDCRRMRRASAAQLGLNDAPW